MQVMTKRKNRYVLEVKVQDDDAYLDVEHSGGKVGRCSENKVPFIAAVSVSYDGRPLRVKLTPVSGFKLKAISLLAQDHLVPDSAVLSDGLACFGTVSETACIYQPTGMAERKPKDVPEIK